MLVTVRWGDTVLATRRLSGEAEAAVGAAPGAIAAVPCGALGREGFVFASVRGGCASVHVPAACVGQICEGGSARDARLVAGPATVPLAAGGAATLYLGGFHLLAAASADEDAAWASPEAAGALGPLPHIAFAAFAHAVLFGLAAQSAYASELSEDRAPSVADLRGYLAAAELRTEARDPIRPGEIGHGAGRTLDDRAGNGKAAGGRRAEGDEGTMGTRLSREARPRRFAAPDDDPDRPSLAQQSGAGAPLWTSLVGAVTRDRAHAPHASFGDAVASAGDAIAAQGEMWARSLGEHEGAGGLGLTGVGQGGGGDGRGVGLLEIGTVGHGRGPLGVGTGGNGAPLTGLRGGGGWGSWRGGTRSRGRIRWGWGHGVSVSGRLPPETIQRIIRLNFGRFRACYEQGLARNPALAGRVATRFVIGRDGAVSNVADAGSELPDGAVTSCVVRAFYGLSFPQPEGGIVSVVYPIVFSPSG